MGATTHMVTLANGQQVPWEDFSTWSIFKQNGSLFPACPTGKIKSLKKWNLQNSQFKSSAHKDSFLNIRKITRNYGSNNGSAKVVMTPNGQFPSRISAAKHYGVSSKKMYDWIKSELIPDFYYLESSIALPKKLGNKSISSPDGAFESIEAAARNYGVTARTIKNWIKYKAESGFRYDTDSEKNFLIPGAKRLMTSDGEFASLKLASEHFGVQEATIKKWIIKSRPNFYFL